MWATLEVAVQHYPLVAAAVFAGGYAMHRGVRKIRDRQALHRLGAEGLAARAGRPTVAVAAAG